MKKLIVIIFICLITILTGNIKFSKITKSVTKQQQITKIEQKNIGLSQEGRQMLIKFLKQNQP